jgi:hypothetical protein
MDQLYAEYYYSTRMDFIWLLILNQYLETPIAIHLIPLR